MYKLQLIVNHSIYVPLFLFSMVLISCRNTSTPNEFLYDNHVLYETYQEDILNLQKIILERLDTIQITKEPETVYEHRKYYKTIVDTIFYGPEDKIVFLSVSIGKDKYVAESQLSNLDGIVYEGECYIGYKKDDDYVIIKSLKYAVNSSQSYMRVLKSLRQMYYKEMRYIECKYNINDIRFWNSEVWKAGSVGC